MSCYNDFANAYADQIVRIAPRTTPLETRIEDPKKKLNKLIGELIHER